MDAGKGQFKTMDEYIKTFPEQVQVILEKNEADDSKGGAGGGRGD
jgi:hypothetical protein